MFPVSLKNRLHTTCKLVTMQWELPSDLLVAVVNRVDKEDGLAADQSKFEQGHHQCELVIHFAPVTKHFRKQLFFFFKFNHKYVCMCDCVCVRALAFVCISVMFVLPACRSVFYVCLYACVCARDAAPECIRKLLLPLLMHEFFYGCSRFFHIFFIESITCIS